MQICVAMRYNSEYIHGTAQPSARPLDNCFSFFLLLLLLLLLEREEKKKWHFSINRATDKRFSAVVVVVVEMIVVVKGKKEKGETYLATLAGEGAKVEAGSWLTAHFAQLVHL